MVSESDTIVASYTQRTDAGERSIFLPAAYADADLRSDDIVREPAIPEDWTAEADFVLGGPAMAIDVEGDIAYVGIGAHLVAMDVSGDGEPVTLGASPPLPGLVKDVEVRDGVAYAAVSQVRTLLDDPGGLFVLDVSDLADLRVVGFTPIVGGATDVAIDGDRALLLSAESDRDEPGGFAKFIGLTLVDISTPSIPRRERRWPIAFDELGTDVEILGDTGYVCDGVLFELNLKASPPPRPTRPGFPCSRLKLFESRTRLAVAADLHSGEPPNVTLVDPTALERFERIELIDDLAPRRDPVEFIEDLVASGEDEDVLIVSGWSLDETSAVGRIDISDWPAVTSAWTPINEIVGLAVAEHDDRAIVAAAADPSNPSWAYRLWDIGLMHILGSAVAVIPAPASVTTAPIVVRTGPGTMIIGIESVDERLYVLDGSVDERGGLLWAFDGTSRYPKVLGSAPFDDRDETVKEDHGYSIAANRTGVFLAGEEGVINVYDIRGGTPVKAGAVASQGLIAAEGEALFVADPGGQLVSFDASDPTAPSMLSTFDLPPYDLQSIALDDGLMWLGGGDWFGSEPPDNFVIDVREPSRPVHLGPFPRSDSTEDHAINAWRIEADGDSAYVYEPGSEFGSYGSRIIALRIPLDDGPPVLRFERTLAAGFADADTIYPAASALWADRFWISRRWCSICDEDLRLISIDVRDPADPARDQMHELAAAVLARNTLRFKDRDFGGPAMSITASDDRLFIARIKGGLMGSSSVPREATWSFDGDEALDGEGRDEGSGEGRTDDRRFDRPRDLTDASPPEPAAGRSATIIDMPETAAAASEHAAAQERPAVPIFLPAVYADANLRSADIVREPAIPSVWTPDADWVLGGPAMAVDAWGDVGFYGVGAHLVAMDLSGDGAPEPIGYSPPLPGQVSDVVVRDGTAFVTVAQIRQLDGMPGGLFTLDVSDPTAPRLMGIGPINGGASALAVDGDRALVVSAISEWNFSSAQRHFRGLSLFDVSDPSSPRRVARWPDRSLFSSFVSDAVIHGGLAFVCKHQLFALDLESDAYPIKVSPSTECSHVTIDRERERLVVVDDRITTFALDEPRRSGDTLVLAEVGRSPLFSPGSDIRRSPWILDADLEDGRLLVGGALGGSDRRGFLQRMEITGVEPTDRRLTFTGDDVPFGVALHDDLALTAGARDWNGRSTDVEEMIDEGAIYSLGSAAAIYHESSPGELVRRGALVGPSTLVVRSLAHEGRLHLIDMAPNAFDIDPSSDRKNATFWSFDVTGPFPRLIGSSPIRYPFGLQADLLTQAASSRALFFSEADSLPNTLVVDISDGVPREVGRLPVGGRIAANGDVLYVLTSANVLEVYDVRDPSAPVLAIPIRLESLGLPNFIHVTAFAASDELLWLGMQPDFHGATTVSRARAASAEHSASRPWLAVLDIRNPLRPRLAGRLEIEESLPTSHTNVIELLTLGDRAIALGIAIDPLPAEGEIPFIERAISIVAHPAPESRSPPSPAIIARAISIVAHGAGERLEVEDVVDFPAPSERRFIWPFTMAATGGRLWFGSPGYPVIVEDAEEFGLIEVALDETMPMEIVGAYRLPASMLARLSDGLAWLQHEVVEGLQLDSLGERLLVTRMEGGVAAIDTRLEPPRWIPSPFRERTGPASTSALIHRIRIGSPFDRTVPR